MHNSTAFHTHSPYDLVHRFPDHMNWRKATLLHGSQASDSAKGIQSFNSCQTAKAYKYLKI